MPGAIGSRSPTLRIRYPGCAGCYPEREEVDHEKLIARLVRWVPGRVGAGHLRAGATAGPRSLPARRAGVLAASACGPDPLPAPDLRVGAADPL